MDINDYVDVLFKNNYVLLDVRTKEEYDSGHIDHSINIPLDEISEAYNKLNKSDTIYVYCRSGRRSEIASIKLKEMGFNDVTNIGGILDYKGILIK